MMINKLKIMGVFSVFIMLSLMTFSTAAMANCSAPEGTEGEQVYNETYKVMQYCDGTDWVAMNAIDANAAVTTLGTSLADKVSKAGDTMTGLLSLSGAPTANDHAANKEYVDTVLAAGGTGSNGRYQVSCWSSSDTGYYNACVLLDTQTGATKCQSYSQRFDQTGAWADCGGQMNITSLTGGGIPESGGAGLYALNAFAWGSNSSGKNGNGQTSSRSDTPSQIDLNLTFTKIMGGNQHACGLASNKLYCWGSGSGNNSYYYRPPFDASDYATPQAADLSGLGYPDVTDIVIGRTKGAMRLSNGQWYGWGSSNYSNNYYNFGSTNNYTVAQWRTATNGASGNATLPSDFTKVTFGTGHMCALRSNGKVHCAGSTNNGANYMAIWGDGVDSNCTSGGGSISYSYLEYLQQYCPVSGTQTFTDIAVGGGQAYGASCAVATDGKVYCWGYVNSVGQLGKGDTSNGDGTPTAVDTSSIGSVTFSKVYGDYMEASNQPHFCALSDAGKAYCWGYNNYGQLGTGDTSNRTKPTPVLGNYAFEELALSEQHTCGLTTSGLVYCWGYGAYGQLGYGSTSNKLIPEPVSAASDYVGIGVGEQNTYGWK